MFQQKPTVLDIFSGIGGFSIGLEKAGMETLAFCEMEKYGKKLLNKYWPDVPVFPDVCELNSATFVEHGLEVPNVIAGGFPCQDISCAGKQAGIGGERSGLWKEFKRLIDELEPNYAIAENVANLRSNGLVTVLYDLWEIGYNAEWHCIPASAIGAPHRRDRIWIVAYPSRARSEWSRRIRLSTKISKDVSNANGNGCKDIQSETTRKNGDERQECFKVANIDRDVVATIGLPLFKGRLEKNEEWRELPTSKPLIEPEVINAYRDNEGFKQWNVEPDIPRLANNKLNPDWVEWLMGFPSQWTEGGTYKQRLMGLGNAVVPQIPEIIGRAIMKKECAVMTAH